MWQSFSLPLCSYNAWSTCGGQLQHVVELCVRGCFWKSAKKKERLWTAWPKKKSCRKKISLCAGWLGDVWVSKSVTNDRGLFLASHQWRAGRFLRGRFKNGKLQFISAERKQLEFAATRSAEFSRKLLMTWYRIYGMIQQRRNTCWGGRPSSVKVFYEK